MISITQGDTPTFQFTAGKGDGTAMDITGAVFETTILGTSAPVVLDNTKHAIVSESDGTFTVAPTAADTVAMKEGTLKDVVTKITQGSAVTFLRGKQILTVYPPLPQR